MQTGTSLSLSLVLTALTAVPAFANDVHVVDATGAGDYLTIQQAVNGATDGDLLLVRPGSYPSFVVDDLDIVIVADGGAVTTGTIRARNLSEGKVLVLDGLDAQGAQSSSPSSSRGGWFINCEGSIRVQHCAFQAADSNSSSAENGWEGVVVEDCNDVSFTSCDMGGGVDSGSYIENASSPIKGGTGLQISSSLVSMYASNVLGGDGHAANTWDAGAGGDGARVVGDSHLLAHSSDIRGGDGGGTSFDYGWGGDGGAGLVSNTTLGVDLLGCNLLGGFGGGGSGCFWCGFGQNGPYTSGSSIQTLPGSVLDLVLVDQLGPIREGAAVGVTIAGHPGSRATMLYSYGADRRALALPARLLLLDTPLIRLIPGLHPIPIALPATNFLGAFNSSGALSVTIQAGSLGPGIEGERVLAQPFHVPASGTWNLGAPLVIIVVDSSL